MAGNRNILDWLCNWFARQCDGDWEHMYGIKIETTDNPGWSIEIDLRDTNLEDLDIPWKLIEYSDANWYGIAVKDRMFTAAGDLTKLTFLLEKFKEIVESQDDVKVS